MSWGFIRFSGLSGFSGSLAPQFRLASIYRLRALLGSAGGGGDASMQPVGAVLRLRLRFAFGRHSGERQNPGGRVSALVLGGKSVGKERTESEAAPVGGAFVLWNHTPHASAFAQTARLLLHSLPYQSEMTLKGGVFLALSSIASNPRSSGLFQQPLFGRVSPSRGE